MSGYKDDWRGASGNTWWTLPRASFLAVGAIVAVYLILVVTTPLTIGFGWFRGEANLRSFQHVQQTYSVAFDDARAMDANARQACRYYQPSLPLNEQSDQYNAVADNYDRLQGEYDAYMQDHFRGGIIRPKQLPLPYPNIAARMKRLC